MGRRDEEDKITRDGEKHDKRFCTCHPTREETERLLEKYRIFMRTITMEWVQRTARQELRKLHLNWYQMRDKHDGRTMTPEETQWWRYFGEAYDETWTRGKYGPQ